MGHICYKCDNLILPQQERMGRTIGESGRTEYQFYHQHLSDCNTKTLPGILVRKLRQKYKLTAPEVVNRLTGIIPCIDTKKLYRMEKNPMADSTYQKIRAAIEPVKTFAPQAATKKHSGGKPKLSATVKNNRIAQGKEIKSLRLEKGITRVALAKQLGISEDKLEAYERGRSTMDTTLYIHIKDVIKSHSTYKIPEKRCAVQPVQEPYDLMEELMKAPVNKSGGGGRVTEEVITKPSCGVTVPEDKLRELQEKASKWDQLMLLLQR